ncbi:MAG: TVP38/TMEM64 family protein [Gemmatimonadota bacterium]
MSRNDPATRRSTWLRTALLALAALSLLLVLGRWGGQYVPRFTAWIGGLGPLGPALFIAGYIVATVAGIPGSLLTLAAGAIFGLWAGVAYVFVGATLGASAAFLVSRYVARSAIERRISGNPRFQAIDRSIAEDGRRIVFLLRLSPVFPFTLLNYALGLSRVRFIDFVVASVGMLPGTVLFVYYGKLAGDVAAVAGGAAPARGAGYYALLGLGLAATILVTVVITRAAKRALQAGSPELS